MYALFWPLDSVSVWISGSLLNGQRLSGYSSNKLHCRMFIFTFRKDWWSQTKTDKSCKTWWTSKTSCWLYGWVTKYRRWSDDDEYSDWIISSIHYYLLLFCSYMSLQFCSYISNNTKLYMSRSRVARLDLDQTLDSLIIFPHFSLIFFYLFTYSHIYTQPHPQSFCLLSGTCTALLDSI